MAGIWSGAVDNLFSNASNWDSKPTSGVVATFPTGTPACNIDENINVLGVDMQSGYTNALTQNAGFTIIVGASGWLLVDGSFVGGDSQIDINGVLTVTAGKSFTETSDRTLIDGHITLPSGTFTKNGGQVVSSPGVDRNIDTNSNPFNDFEFEAGSSRNATLLSDMVVDGLVHTKNMNSINGFVLKLRGDLDMTDTSIGGSTLFEFDGTGAQSIDAIVSGGMMSKIKINKASGTLTFLSDVRVQTDFEYVQGTIDQNGFYYVCGQIGTGSTRSIIVGSYIFDRFKCDGGSSNTTTFTGDLIVTIDFWTKSSNALSGDDILVRGSWTNNDTSIGGNSTITFDGTSDQDLITTVAVTLMPSGNLLINKASGKVLLQQNTDFSGSAVDLTMQLGTLDLNTFTWNNNDWLFMNGGTIIGGEFTCDKYDFSAGAGIFDPTKAISNSSENTTLFIDAFGVSFMPSGGDFEFKGGNHWSISQVYTEFPHLILNKCPTCGQGGQWYAQDVTNTTNKIGTGFIRGDLISDGFNTGGASGTQTFDGTGIQSITGEMTFSILQFDKASGLLSFNNDYRMEGCNIISGAEFVDFKTSHGRLGDGGGHLVTWSVAGLEFYSLELFIATSGGATMNNTVILGNFTITQTQTLSGDITLGGNLTVNDATVSNNFALVMNGSSDQTVFLNTPATSGLNVSVVVNKPSGSVIQLSDVGSNTLDLIVLKGIWCTNEFNLDAEDITISTDNAELQKTPTSVITTVNPIIGTVTNVSECGKKNSILAIL